MVLLQSVVAAVLMERHWQMVTQRLSMAVTRDIAAVIEMIDTYPQDTDYSGVIRIARDQLNLQISIEPDGELPPPRIKTVLLDPRRHPERRDPEQIKRPFWIDTVGNSDLVEVRIKLDNKILRVLTKRSQAYASNTHIFIVWMVGASLVLITISILFLRGQIRPILKLAPRPKASARARRRKTSIRAGADEVRRAGLAFILMRERIERQMEQRTAMLTGVSHDLRTILTRFKLQLALAGDNPDLQGISDDVNDMQSMLEAYMAFARGEVEEDVGELKLSELLAKLEPTSPCTARR
jgi:two-component system osmolarity sensor histidine kinase EnvZ